MKKITSKIVLFVAMFVSVIGLIACGSAKELAAPDITVSNQTVTWNANENASKYKVEVKQGENVSDETTVTTNSYTLKSELNIPGLSYKVSVQSIAGSKDYKDSKWSTSQTIEIAKQKLSTPVAVLNGNTLTWSAVTNAVSYDIYVDGTKVTNVTVPSYTLSITTPNEYEITVKAIGNQTNYLDSDASTAQDYTLLPTLTYVTNSEQELTSEKIAVGATISKELNKVAKKSFVGWFFDEDFQTPVTIMPNENKTIYAKWEDATVTLTPKANPQFNDVVAGELVSLDIKSQKVIVTYNDGLETEEEVNMVASDINLITKKVTFTYNGATETCDLDLSATIVKTSTELETALAGTDSFIIIDSGIYEIDAIEVSKSVVLLGVGDVKISIKLDANNDSKSLIFNGENTTIQNITLENSNNSSILLFSKVIEKNGDSINSQIQNVYLENVTLNALADSDCPIFINVKNIIANKLNVNKIAIGEASLYLVSSNMTITNSTIGNSLQGSIIIIDAESSGITLENNEDSKTYTLTVGDNNEIIGAVIVLEVSNDPNILFTLNIIDQANWNLYQLGEAKLYVANSKVYNYYIELLTNFYKREEVYTTREFDYITNAINNFSEELIVLINGLQYEEAFDLFEALQNLLNDVPTINDLENGAYVLLNNAYMTFGEAILEVSIDDVLIILSKIELTTNDYDAYSDVFNSLDIINPEKIYIRIATTENIIDMLSLVIDGVTLELCESTYNILSTINITININIVGQDNTVINNDSSSLFSISSEEFTLTNVTVYSNLDGAIIFNVTSSNTEVTLDNVNVYVNGGTAATYYLPMNVTVIKFNDASNCTLNLKDSNLYAGYLSGQQLIVPNTPLDGLNITVDKKNYSLDGYSITGITANNALAYCTNTTGIYINNGNSFTANIDNVKMDGFSYAIYNFADIKGEIELELEKITDKDRVVNQTVSLRSVTDCVININESDLTGWFIIQNYVSNATYNIINSTLTSVSKDVVENPSSIINLATDNIAYSYNVAISIIGSTLISYQIDLNFGTTTDQAGFITATAYSIGSVRFEDSEFRDMCASVICVIGEKSTEIKVDKVGFDAYISDLFFNNDDPSYINNKLIEALQGFELCVLKMTKQIYSFAIALPTALVQLKDFVNNPTVYQAALGITDAEVELVNRNKALILDQIDAIILMINDYESYIQTNPEFVLYQLILLGIPSPVLNMLGIS